MTAGGGLVLDSFDQAVTALDRLLAQTEDPGVLASLDEVTRRGLKAGCIQYFEFTYELAWKFIKRWLERQVGGTYVDGVSRRELFRLAAEHLLIEDVDLWMDFHKARNLTSHTYSDAAAEDAYQAARRFCHEVKRLLTVLESRND